MRFQAFYAEGSFEGRKQDAEETTVFGLVFLHEELLDSPLDEDDLVEILLVLMNDLLLGNESGVGVLQGLHYQEYLEPIVEELFSQLLRGLLLEDQVLVVPLNILLSFVDQSD